MSRAWEIVEDIRRAETLPGWVYADAEIFARSLEHVFARSWQLVGDSDALSQTGSVVPTRFLSGSLDTPLVLTRDGDAVHCLSNVCTHRGNLVCDKPSVERSLRCRYHGRRFALDGTMSSMPEFENVSDFPSAKDNLPKLPVGRWRNLIFASLAPRYGFDAFADMLERRVGFLPLDQAKLVPERCRVFEVKAHWALYCDNYLEGFHIPYVHAGLNRVIDYGDYKTELFKGASLQLGTSSKIDNCFELPASSPDHGQHIAAYYFWLFPNTMLNFYPWGLSVNRVLPVSPSLTRVSYLTYVWDASRLDKGAGANLEVVEHEDEEVVESVQQGVRSRLYERGRYSPTRETGVHHFHRLLTEWLAQGA